MDWKNKTVNYSFLQQLTERPYVGSIQEWLQFLGIVPKDHKQRHGVRTVTPSMDSCHIPAGVLAELAWDFDHDGSGTPQEFVEGIAFELKDHPRRLAVGEILSALGNTKEEEIE